MMPAVCLHSSSLNHLKLSGERKADLGPLGKWRGGHLLSDDQAGSSCQLLQCLPSIFLWPAVAVEMYEQLNTLTGNKDPVQNTILVLNDT